MKSRDIVLKNKNKKAVWVRLNNVEDRIAEGYIGAKQQDLLSGDVDNHRGDVVLMFKPERIKNDKII